MKKLALATVVATLLSSATSFAAPETYNIDSTHSMPRFEYSHFGYSTQLSRFDKATGKITIDRATKTGSVDVVIDATTVDSGFPLFNTHLQDEDFFNTAKYPTITFKSTSVKFDGDKVASVDGDLTVKGVTKPVTLTLQSFFCMPHPMLKKDACGATATTKIKRTDFNMGKYVPYVSDEVTLTIPVEAVKE
ncbi:MAG: YceI family protein [Methylophilaceae bacterium]|jgi:polyisoprenoid-binding protein YceI|nr:YceI family protein [Methyloradius sp.]